MSDKKGKISISPEIAIILCCFVLMCIATLVSIIPGVDASSWATYFCGVIGLVGVIYCSKKSLYMAVDSFVLMYPKGLQKFLHILDYVISLVFLVILFIAGIVGAMTYGIPESGSSILDIAYCVQYFIPVVVYPFAFFFHMRNKPVEAKKEGGNN